MFSGRKPIYLVFRNKGESFYLESTLCLDYNNYLWYKLKEAGYSRIYFLNNPFQDKVSLLVPDAKSYENNTYHPRKFLSMSRKLWNNKDPFAGGFAVSVKTDDAAGWVAERLQEKNTAVITDMQTLSQLFPTSYPEKLQSLIESSQEGTGALIISCPQTLTTDERELLVGKNSIFGKSHNGRSLFPPLYSLITAGNENAVIFDELKKSAAEQMPEPGYLDFDQCKTLLKRVEFARDELWTEEEWLERANYLYYWLTKEAVKRDSAGLFDGITGTVTNRKLYDNLTGAGMTAFLERVNRTKQVYHIKNPGKEGVHLSQMLFELYGAKDLGKGVCHVELEEGSLRTLASTAWPSACDTGTTNFDTILKVGRDDWDSMRKGILKPRNRRLDKERLKWITSFLTYVSTAGQSGDYDTLRRAVNLLMYCGNNLYAAPLDKYEDYCKKGQLYLQASAEFFSHLSEEKKLENMAGAESTMVKGQILKARLERTKLQETLKNLDGVFVRTTPVSDKLSEETFQALEGLSQDSEGSIDFSREVEETPVSIDDLTREMSEEDAFDILEN